MGNRRSVQKAFEHVGADATITRDHDVLRDADALVVPGVGAFPLAMANLTRPRPRRADPRAGRRGNPDPRDLPRDAVAVRPLARARSDRGSRAVHGEVTPIDSGGLRIPHIGWNEVRFEHPSPLTGGLPADGCPFYHVHSLAPRPSRRRATSSAPPSTASGSRRSSRTGRSSGCSSTRRSPRATASRCSATSRGSRRRGAPASASAAAQR